MSSNKALLHPLRFAPKLYNRVWGGEKLIRDLNKTTTLGSVGESWEISGVPNKESIVLEGEHKGQTLNDLIVQYGAEFLGQKVYERFGGQFPLLVKFIDAAKPLSVQVHPNDDWAQKEHNSFGKNEMWYLLDTDPNASISLGFDRKLSPEALDEHIAQGTLEEVLNTIPVACGDAFNIPTGLVHAIGAGVLLAEIQQTSDITYRIFDYNRTDPVTGEKRPLHVGQAKKVADFSSVNQQAIQYEKTKNTVNALIATPYFKSHYLHIEGRLERSLEDLDSFVILIGVSGTAELSCAATTYTLNRGEVLLLPACLKHFVVHAAQAKMLEVYIP